MILAVSRFKVANGMESQVREAFLNRPHLVDSARGFLGMETYTDKSDAALFYLVTRWTDDESFHTWHGSEAHRESHRFMPKGLKLDGSYTQVIELDRIEPPPTQRGLDEITTDASALLTRFISDSSALHLILAASDGTILKVNAAVVRRTLLSTSELEGSSIWQRLTTGARERLRTRVELGDRSLDEPLMLNFLDRENSPYSIVCRLDLLPDGFVIVGEPPLEKERALQAEMEALNNELVMLSRENARKKHELEKALNQLKEAQATLMHREKRKLIEELREANTRLEEKVSDRTQELRERTALSKPQTRSRTNFLASPRTTCAPHWAAFAAWPNCCATAKCRPKRRQSFWV
jgi:heme-degrading monooxygenase HmoA